MALTTKTLSMAPSARTSSWQAAQNLVQVFRCLAEREDKGEAHKDYVHIVKNKLAIKQEPTEQNIRSFIPLIKKTLENIKLDACNSTHSDCFELRTSIRNVQDFFLEKFKITKPHDKQKRNQLSEKICALSEIEELVVSHCNKPDIFYKTYKQKQYREEEASRKKADTLIHMFNWLRLKISGIDMPGQSFFTGGNQPRVDERVLAIKDQLGELTTSRHARSVRVVIQKVQDLFQQAYRNTWFFQFSKLRYLKEQLVALKEIKQATKLTIDEFDKFSNT